ncbi:MAG: division/cell wall cluster transcriptional repressor MraZ [Bacteroidetes bacterium 4572_77]|nr:MAG: division/cell wall cluster transcriptional repressor MraZ [Bacteroidetes bacterium 4572_77]
MINLVGSFGAKADAKYRIPLPSKLKKQVQSIADEGFILKKSLSQNYLELFPLSNWNNEAEELLKLNRFSKKNNDFIRIFMAGVRSVDMDSSGRIQIPKELVAYAGIKKDLILTSAIDRVEIWDKDAYYEFLNNPELNPEELGNEVMGDKNPTL